MGGGFGVAKNLCNLAVKGAYMEVDPTVDAIIKSFHKAKKPIGVSCIARYWLPNVYRMEYKLHWEKIQVMIHSRILGQSVQQNQWVPNAFLSTHRESKLSSIRIIR